MSEVFVGPLRDLVDKVHSSANNSASYIFYSVAGQSFLARHSVLLGRAFRLFANANESLIVVVAD